MGTFNLGEIYEAGVRLKVKILFPPFFFLSSIPFPCPHSQRLYLLLQTHLTAKEFAGVGGETVCERVSVFSYTFVSGHDPCVEVGLSAVVVLTHPPVGKD